MVTAVYNRAATILQALESVSAQTFPAHEHIVIDGGSNDGTLEKLTAISDKRIKLVSGPDDGIYDALNKGLRKCEGDVVGLIHSDDLLNDKHVLADVAEAFEDPAVDAVYGDLVYVKSDATDVIVRYWQARPFSMRKLKLGWMPPHPTLFVKRKLLERIGLYDTSFSIAGDYEFVLRLFSDPKVQARYIPRILVRMRTGGESNASFRKIIRKSREDYRALRKTDVGGLFTLILKNASKLPQLATRPPNTAVRS